MATIQAEYKNSDFDWEIAVLERSLTDGLEAKSRDSSALFASAGAKKGLSAFNRKQQYSYMGK